jgi:hypothetical protein
LKTNSINTIEEQRAKKSALKGKEEQFSLILEGEEEQQIFFFMKEHL